MIKIKDLTVKNFMSVGNQTQAVDFNKQQLTLVLGENLDQGGDDAGLRGASLPERLWLFSKLPVFFPPGG